jgi:hypothetical protein
MRLLQSYAYGHEVCESHGLTEFFLFFCFFYFLTFGYLIIRIDSGQILFIIFFIVIFLYLLLLYLFNYII